MSESAEISTVGLPITYIMINYEVFVKFQSNLTSLRSLMIKFYLKIVYKQ